MRKWTFWLIAVLLFAFPSFVFAASIAEQEIRNSIAALERKMDELAISQKREQEDVAKTLFAYKQDLAEAIRLLSENGEKNRLEAHRLLREISSQLNLLIQRPVTLPLPPATLLKVSSTSPAPSAPPISPTSVVIPPVPPSTSPLLMTIPNLVLIVPVLGIMLLVIFIVLLRRDMKKLEGVLHDKRPEPFVNNVSPRDRPYLTIQREAHRLLLINEGGTIAEDIRLFSGSAPRTMKQKIKTASRLRPREREEIMIAMTPGEEALYMNLEYKNSLNGRVYKDQFVMKPDRVHIHEHVHEPVEQVS